jgi:peptidoglycan/xylan/chitin deacetylase (PgdA/CDA1 family)
MHAIKSVKATSLSEDPASAKRRTLMSQREYGPGTGEPRLLRLLAHLKVPATFFSSLATTPSAS